RVPRRFFFLREKRHVMSTLFMSNIPFDCHEVELQQWVESHGFKVESIRVIQDSVTGASPSFGYISLHDGRLKTDAVQILNGQKLRGRVLQVKEDWRRNNDHLNATPLTLKRREVDYVLTLDEIADLTTNADKPAETLANVVALIAKHFQT